MKIRMMARKRMTLTEALLYDLEVWLNDWAKGNGK